jgi:hypothetical protein
MAFGWQINGATKQNKLMANFFSISPVGGQPLTGL